MRQASDPLGTNTRVTSLGDHSEQHNEFDGQRGSVHSLHLLVYHSQFPQQRVRCGRHDEDQDVANGDEYVSHEPCRQRHDNRLGYSAATGVRHNTHGRI